MTRPDPADEPAERAVAGFFDDLARSLEGVEATDEAGRSLGFRAGMRRAVALIVAQTGRGRKLMFIGNGASSAIASHQSVDYWKTGGMRAIAFNDAALLTCLGNDFGYPSVFEKPVAMFADAGDVLMAISSSGRSENIIRAVRAARDKACPVVTMSGFSSDNPLRHLGDVNFYVPSKSYGQVEIAHLSLSHCLLDTIVTLDGSHPRPADGSHGRPPDR